MNLKELFPEEGKVYECILITKSNLTPIGIVRVGDFLKFKIFEGRSFEDLSISNFAIVQIVDDIELLVSLAFNIFPNLEFEPALKVPLKKIKGYPWVEGRVNCHKEVIEDEVGKSLAKNCTLTPIYIGMVKKLPRPISRADNYLLEFAIIATRILVARKRGLRIDGLLKKAEEAYEMYIRLGGKSKIAEEINELIKRE